MRLEQSAGPSRAIFNRRSLGPATEALRRIPLIVVTSDALSGDDADAYVAKPFSPRAMLAKVREYLKD